MSDCPTAKRRAELRQARQVLFELPRNDMFEVAGHPTVYYELRDYRHHPGGKEEGIRAARADVGFMFKAFETGQVGLPSCACSGHTDKLSCAEGNAALHSIKFACMAACMSGEPEAGRDMRRCALAADTAAPRPEDVVGGGASDSHHPRVPGLDGDSRGCAQGQRPGAHSVAGCRMMC